MLAPVQAPNDVVIVPHDQARDCLDLHHTVEYGAVVIPPNKGHPFAGHDHVWTDNQPREEAIELAKQHGLVADGVAAKKVIQPAQLS